MKKFGVQQRWEENQVPLGVPFFVIPKKIEDRKINICGHTYTTRNHVFY
jgi:hypothetical protein